MLPVLLLLWSEWQYFTIHSGSVKPAAPGRSLIQAHHSCRQQPKLKGQPPSSGKSCSVLTHLMKAAAICRGWFGSPSPGVSRRRLWLSGGSAVCLCLTCFGPELLENKVNEALVQCKNAALKLKRFFQIEMYLLVS